MDSPTLYEILFITVFTTVKSFKFVGTNFLRLSFFYRFMQFLLFTLFHMIKFHNSLRIKKSEKRFSQWLALHYDVLTELIHISVSSLELADSFYMHINNISPYVLAEDSHAQQGTVNQWCVEFGEGWGSCRWASPCPVWSTWTPSPTMSPGCPPWMRSDTFLTCLERPRLTETSRWVSKVMYAFKCVKNKIHSKTWLKRSAMDKFIWLFINLMNFWLYS